MTATTQANDPTRMYVAMCKLCKALGVPADADVPDHVLLERLAEKAISNAVDAKLAEPPPVYKLCVCPCPGCVRSGDA